MATSDSAARMAEPRAPDDPPTNPRTSIRDAILASVSEELDEDAVLGVEWASVDDTRLATYAARFPAWDVVDPANWRVA